MTRSVRALAAATAVLVAVILVLSQRDRLPAVLGIDAERLEPYGHAAAGAVLTMVTAVLAERVFDRATSPVRAALVAIGTVGIGTTLIELAQIPLRSRSAGLADIGANLVGVAIGAALFVGLRHLSATTTTVAAWMMVLAGIGGGVWAATADVPLGFSCDTVVAADPPQEPRPTIPTEALQFGYDLSAPSPNGSPGRPPSIPELGGFGALQAIGEGTIDPSASGMIFTGQDGDAMLISRRAGRRISTAVRHNDNVAFEVVATPSAETDGPARIAAISNGRSPSGVNIHIGQHGRELSVRVRLGCGQFNWTRIDDVFSPGERRHIFVTYAEETQRVWVDDVLVDERTFSGHMVGTGNWDMTMPLVAGNKPLGDRQFVGEIELVRVGLLSAP